MLSTQRCAIVGFIGGASLVAVVELIIACLMAEEIGPPDIGDIFVTLLGAALMALVGGAIGAGVCAGFGGLHRHFHKRSEDDEIQPKD